jgi:hypothetical protein
MVYQGEAVQPVPWTVIQDRLAARPGLATLLLTTVQPVLPALDGRPGWPGTGVKNTELSELRQLFWQHDDAPTFDSLPGLEALANPATVRRDVPSVVRP